MLVALCHGESAFFRIARLLLFLAIALVIGIGSGRLRAADTGESLPDTFADLAALINNLNLLEPFANPTQIDELDQLVSRLQTIKAKGDQADPAELKAAAEALATALDARRKSFLDSLADTGDALSGEMKESLQRACAGVSQAALKELLVVVADNKQSSDAISALIQDKFAPDRECRAALNLAAKQLAADIKVLDNRLAQLDAEITAAETKLLTATEEERKKLYEEIQKKKAEKKEVEQKRKEKVKAKGKIDLGLVLSGIANILAGYALTVFTAGWGVTLGEALIAGGVAMVGAGLLPLIDSKEEVVERTDRTQVRTDVVENGQPTPGQTDKVREAFQQQGLVNISAGGGGNFLVFLAPEGYWQVVQIDPSLIVAIISPENVEVTQNARSVAALAHVASPMVQTVSNASTRIVIDFAATAPDGAALKGKLSESAGLDAKFLLSVE